jgi:hypothetical protein
MADEQYVRVRLRPFTVLLLWTELLSYFSEETRSFDHVKIIHRGTWRASTVQSLKKQTKPKLRGP